jgi:hypothetical protein
MATIWSDKGNYLQSGKKSKTPAYVKVKRHDHTGVPAKARFHRLLCRGISNAPVEAFAKT